MLKQNKFLLRQYFILCFSKQKFKYKLIKQSLQQNQALIPSFRGFLFIQKYTLKKEFLFWASHKKLVCYLSLSKKVPNKSLLLSRFMLAHYSDSLRVGPYNY